MNICKHVSTYMHAYIHMHACMYVLRIRMMYVCKPKLSVSAYITYIFILFTNILSSKSASVLCKHQLCCITFFSRVRKYIIVKVVKCKRPHCENSQLTLTVDFKYAQS